MPTTLSDLIHQGDLSGYQPGLSRQMVLRGREWQQIDQEVTQQAQCTACGTSGLRLRYFNDGRTYRSFAVCPTCHQADEF